MELVFPTRTSGMNLSCSFTIGITTFVPSLKLFISFNQSRPFPFCSNVLRTDKNTPIITSTSPHIAASYQPKYSAVSTPNNDQLCSSTKCKRWIVVMETPPGSVSSKSEIVDYYVDTLARVLGSEKEAQMCIYDASWQTHFGFCCEIDEEASRQLASVPGVLSVRPDTDEGSISKDFSFTSSLTSGHSTSSGYSSKIISPVPGQNSIYWLVRMEKPKVEVVTKAQVVDYYVRTLTKVLGNEKDAQMSIYNISWEEVFGFCCHIDQECAEELAAIPGVLSVLPDSNINSENKDYEGLGISSTSAESAAPETNQAPKTKRLFVTGLSFYTSEKTLRAAFEGFGELVEVKIIMDKISKRSKGYAFIEYTTEEAAGAALKEMNGKIINGWMIIVDVAKTYPPRNRRGRSQVSTQSTY